LPPRTINPLKAARRAFTLFEVMLAAGVMATGLVGMIQVVVSGAEMLDVGRKQTQAANIIHSLIDSYRASIPSDWSTISTGTTTTYQKLTADSTGSGWSFVSTSTAPTTYQDYFTCTRVISNVVVNGSTVTTLKKIAYTVTWTGVTGRSYSRTGVTYISQYGQHVSQQRI
jgi:Tfp pilus assembly protein PilV